MSKRTSDDMPKKSRLIAGEPAPPLLSEKLIAQLQGAVNSAQQKQMSKSMDNRERRSAEKDS
jgi:hypothetical protein